MSRVDVVIPAFNAASYIEGAIGSVLAQTEPDWHIVVVDDGSTDGTESVVQPYVSRLGGRLTYLRQRNSGPSAARNAAIRATRSPLIAFLDADDYWPSDRLHHTLRAFDRDEETGLAYGRVTRFREPGKLVDVFYGNRGKVEGQVATEIYTRSLEVPCCSVTVRRRCLEDVGLFDETLLATEDRDLWLRIAQRYPVRFIPANLAFYRMGLASQSSDPARMLQTQLRFIEKHYGDVGCGWRERRSALARVYKQQADAYADRKQFAFALRNALHAVVLEPWSFVPIRAAVSISLRSLSLRSPEVSEAALQCHSVELNPVVSAGKGVLDQHR